MKQLILSLLLSSLIFSQEYNARVTYYWTGHITSLGKKPIAGKTIAVDPKIIPYGSKVTIPQMGKTFVAGDVGPAVIAKKASKGKTIVVDIYCSSKAEAQKLIKKYPLYMKIKVEKPNAKTN